MAEQLSNQQSSQQQNTPVQSAKKSFFLPVLLMLLVLSLGSAALLGYQNMQLTKQIALLSAPKPAPFVSPEPTADVDDLNRKTYTNQKYNVRFSYPNDIYVQEETISSPPFLQLTFRRNESNLFRLNARTDANEPLIMDAAMKNISQNNNSWKMYFHSTNPSNQITLTSLNKTIISLVFVADSYHSYSIDQLSDQKSETLNIIDQILSTFRFIDTSEASAKEDKFTCPTGSWVNCMPILTEEAKRRCTKEAIAWYRANCPNFQGVAQ